MTATSVPAVTPEILALRLSILMTWVPPKATRHTTVVLRVVSPPLLRPTWGL